MCRFRWILLVLCMESSRLIVFNSMRKKDGNPTHHRPIEQVILIWWCALIADYSVFFRKRAISEYIVFIKPKRSYVY